MMKSNKLIAIAGPTTSGKSKISIEMGLEIDAEIVSSDSLLLYKHLNIGTAKPSKYERALIKHHMIDIVEPWDNYNISDFYQDASRVIKDIKMRSKNFLVTGGTGFYLNALINSTFESPPTDPDIRKKLEQRLNSGETAFELFNELNRVDPETAKRIHPHDKYRILRALEVYYSSGQTMTFFRDLHESQRKTNFDPMIIVLNPERNELRANIDARTRKMLDDGLVEEVKNLFKIGCTPDLKPLKSIGYRQTVQFLDGHLSQTELLESIKRETLLLAKRQITWFKKQPFCRWYHPTKDINKIKKDIYANVRF